MKRDLINREVSWLHFNARVLQEAMDPSNPLLERLRFIGIYSNNRDEFFRVRVATLRRLRKLKKDKPEYLSYDPSKILNQIRHIIDEQEKAYMETYLEIADELTKYGIHIIDEQSLTQEEGKAVVRYFREMVHPILFPIMLSGLSNPDNLKDNAIYLALILKSSSGELEENYALIKVPTGRMSRFFILPGSTEANTKVMLLDDVIRFNLGEIFLPFGYDSFEAYSIKFTRDAELDIDNDMSKSFIEIMAESLKQRKKGAPVRFIYDKNMPEVLLAKLLKKFRVSKNDMIVGGWKYHNFRDFIEFPKLGNASLWSPELVPIRHPDLPLYRSLFSVISQKDIMLHYPYQSFSHVIDLLREASIDPKVRTIKMTLYRAARDSKVINALVNAARNGKAVTVFLELQARFDEKANIQWSEKLHEEGVKVIKTIPGLKVHSKLLLIRRKEEGKNVYYSYISTGNFNESTARVYADDSLFTCDERTGLEVAQMFQLFETPYAPPEFRNLIVSPYDTRTHFVKLLNAEIRNKKSGKDAWVILKLNSLVDEQLVAKLYQASRAGVKIQIICRGICVLIPGISGKSENIEVTSIVDRFLEHSRVYVFANAGQPLYYISSADWMVRNLDHRFEVTTPVKDPLLQQELFDMLQIQLRDNCKARLVNKDVVNIYKSKKKNESSIRSQIEIYNYFCTKSSQ
ncbi:MAG: polyphosphate kinase 1 [Bacteroidales bacterium]|jgi:polyphosphate kinase|nr:polyphosphate kinase 1 [Bacteroidales bacterium]MDY0085613.1 polyphosphate kinase 1 [Bacteroidales bacterium]